MSTEPKDHPEKTSKHTDRRVVVSTSYDPVPGFSVLDADPIYNVDTGLYVERLNLNVERMTRNELIEKFGRSKVRSKMRKWLIRAGFHKYLPVPHRLAMRMKHRPPNNLEEIEKQFWKHYTASVWPDFPV